MNYFARKLNQVKFERKILQTVNGPNLRQGYGNLFYYGRDAQYYKNNYRSEGIRVANAQTKVIIFCKSHPLNWN